MLTLQVHIWAENAGVEVSQWAPETIGIWQEKGGLKTQQKANNVRDRVREIALSMSISNKLGSGPRKWHLLIDPCISRIRDMWSKWLHSKCYSADKTILNGQKLNTVLDWVTEVGLCLTKKSDRLHPDLKQELRVLWYVP